MQIISTHYVFSVSKAYITMGEGNNHQYQVVSGPVFINLFNHTNFHIHYTSLGEVIGDFLHPTIIVNYSRFTIQGTLTVGVPNNSNCNLDKHIIRNCLFHIENVIFIF